VFRNQGERGLGGGGCGAGRGSGGAGRRRAAVGMSGVVGGAWQAGTVAARTSTRSAGLAWHAAPLAPVVLVSGPEDLLGERAVSLVLEQARAKHGEVEVSEVDASGYQPGALEVLASPSLFGEPRVVLVSKVEACNDPFLKDALAYLERVEEDVVLVLRHGGGVRGKKLLDAIKAGGHPVVACDAVKKDADKTAFVTDELRRAGRRADAGGVRALVEAVGSDLRELASAVAQLVADTKGTIGAQVVEQYYGGRIEATGFRVADAAVEGKVGEAIALLRHALATGVDPVPLVAALAVKLRTLAKVAAMLGRGGLSAGDLGLAPWQVERAQRDLKRWTPETLAFAIDSVAQADAEVKGLSRDPQFAVERAVLRVATAAASR